MSCPECGKPTIDHKTLDIPEFIYEKGAYMVDADSRPVKQNEQYAKQMKAEVERRNGTPDLLPIIEAVEGHDYCVGTGIKLGDHPDQVFFYIHA